MECEGTPVLLLRESEGRRGALIVGGMGALLLLVELTGADEFAVGDEVLEEGQVTAVLLTPVPLTQITTARRGGGMGRSSEGRRGPSGRDNGS